jgi:hypothetical protein
MRMLIAFFVLVAQVSAADLEKKIPKLGRDCNGGWKTACVDLRRIADGGEDIAIRIEAAGALKGQPLLQELQAKRAMDIAKPLSYEEARALVDPITDQTTLLKVALGARHGLISETAASRVIDQAALVKGMLEDNDAQRRAILL